jgi:ADP-ribose pyrophosphatase
MPVQIDVLEDRSAQTPSNKGFIRVQRLTLRTTYEDGTRSDPFAYDVADRDALDAVLMVLHSPRPGAPDDPDVCLRTALRPPIALRARRPIPVPVKDPRSEPMLWEMPAGLIEKGETGDAAVRGTASRETQEEVGLDVPPEAFEPLGVPVYLTPGLIGEKLHMMRAQVDRTQPMKITATEVVEHASKVEWVPLGEALARAARGEIEDCKTELALHRLKAWLVSHTQR